MADMDIIDKIGKYFGEQEAHLRRVYAQAATAPPQSIVYRNSEQQQQRIAANQASGSDEFFRRSFDRAPSLLRQRFSAQSATSVDLDASSPSLQLAARGAKSSPGSVVVTVPPLVLSPHDSLGTTPFRPDDHVWSGEDDFASWLSARSRPETDQQKIWSSHDNETRGKTSSDDDDSEEDNNGSNQVASSRSSSSSNRERRVPSDSLRKEVLKRNCSMKKKKKMRNAKHGADKPNQLDLEELKRENEQKVAAALVLAQERARRIQAERELHAKNQELARRDEQRRVQEEMNKIEAIRQKSKQFALRLRPSSAPGMLDAERSSGLLSVCSSSSRSPCANDTDGNNTSGSPDPTKDAELSTSEDSVCREPTFMDTVERQLRDRMVLELKIREKALSAQQIHETEVRRVHFQLEKQRASNEKKQKRVDALETTKESLERELAKVLGELEVSRSQRIELEDASRKERVQRQREAEKQLRARVRTEEWNRMADDEKVRVEIAADARARAGQRVVSRVFSLKKKAHEIRDARRSSRSNNNNNDNHSDEDGDLALAKSRVEIVRKTPVCKTSLLLPPELAEFEEEGLLDTSNLTAPDASPQSESPEIIGDTRTRQPNISIAPKPEVGPATHSDEASNLHATSSKFEWRLPPFENRELFTQVLVFEIPSP